LFKDQDKDKDFNNKDNDKDKDKDCIVKDKDHDKDCILILKESLRTRTRTNITVIAKCNSLFVLLLPLCYSYYFVITHDLPGTLDSTAAGLNTYIV